MQRHPQRRRRKRSKTASEKKVTKNRYMETTIRLFPCGGFFVVVRLAVHDSKIVKNSVFLQA
jgi:hypothetical protein